MHGTCRRARLQRSPRSARTRAALVVLPVALFGCSSMKDAEKAANDHCAREGKVAVIVERETAEHGGGFYDTATVTAVCVDPTQVVHTTDTFGVLALAEPGVKGALVLQVTSGSIADQAGIWRKDVIFEYRGMAIDTAAALRTAVLATPAGEKVTLKLHRDQREVRKIVQF